MRVKRINKIKFPCLRQWVSIGGRHVVLFTDIKTGTVIDVSGSEYDLGYFSTNWYPCDSETEWKVFEGEITLKN